MNLAAQIHPDECSDTEAWVPVSMGIAGTDSVCVRSVVMNNELYVVSRKAEQSGLYTLSAFNGTTWRTLSHFTAGSTVCNLTLFNGQLYMSGDFDSVEHLPGTNGIARWNGTGWEAVPGCTMINDAYGLTFEFRAAIFPMTVYRNELYVAGFFTDAGNQQRAGILAYNGSTWRTIASYPRDQWYTDSIMVNTMVEWRGNLYVGGFFSNMGGIPVRGLARWDGTTWSAVGSREMRVVQHLFVYHDRLYAFRQWLERDHNPATDQHVTWWDGAVWHDVPDGPLRGRTTDRPGESTVAEFQGSMYIAMRRLIPFNSVSQFRLDTGGIHTFARPDSVINMLQVYNGELYAGGEFISACGVPLNHFAKLCTSFDCAGIAGRVVKGGPGGCDDTSRTAGLVRSMVELLPGPRYAITDQDGYYRHFAETGTYEIRLVPRRYWAQTCPDSPPTYSIAVNSPQDVFAGRSFAAQPMPDVHDLSMSLTAGRMRIQTPISYTINCENVGTVASDGNVWLAFDGRLGFDSSSVMPERGTASALNWNLHDVAPGEVRSIRVWMHLPPSVPLGTGICVRATVECGGDADTWNNADGACAPALGSYDPNDISVLPAGVGEKGELGHNDSILTYTVRFENTGNDTAYSVVVVDSISPNMDMTSLVLGAASHPYALSIIGPRSLVWRFNGIMLPASSNGNGVGQGYFTYSMRMHSNLPPGTEIQNSASIYFDYNVPVPTNTVISTTALPSNVEPIDAVAEQRLYPNPTRGILYVRGPIERGTEVIIRDLMGRDMGRYRCADASGMTIDLTGLAAGLYIATMRTAHGVVTERVGVVR